jgi:hypothetical protein
VPPTEYKADGGEHISDYLPSNRRLDSVKWPFLWWPPMALRGIVSVWVGVAVIWHSAHAHADAAEVEALIAKGNELRRAGTPGPALPYFQKAYELARSPRTSGQLGLAELAAGYPVDAVDHLESALQSPNDPGIVKYRKMLTDALTLARSQIGNLAVDGAPAGAEVVVDGRVVGVLPLSAPVRLAARDVEVVVRSPGYEPLKRLVSIAGGQRQALTINLEKIEKPAELPPPPQAARPPIAPMPTPAAPAPLVVEQHAGADHGSRASGSALRTAAWLVGGGAVVALGAGAALNLASRSNSSDFDSSCVNMNGIHMAADHGLTPDECVDRYDAWKADRKWSIASYALGGALAITSGVLFWASRPTSSSTAGHAHVACSATPRGLACEGVF